MGVSVFRSKNTFMKRCDRCHKQTHYIYRMQLGQFSYNFCSGLCADAARKEYEKKEKLGITPTNPEPITDLIEDGDENG